MKHYMKPELKLQFVDAVDTFSISDGLSDRDNLVADNFEVGATIDFNELT